MTNAAPTYREFAPRATLRDFVHCVWTFDGPADETPQPIAPDGRPELIVHLGAPYWERMAAGDVAQAPVVFAGQLTRPLLLIARGPASVIGVRFHAFAARAFLGRDADAATDRRLALEEGDLVRAVRAGPASDVVQDFVEARLRVARVDGDVRAVVEAMFAGGAAQRPESASERAWQRRFKAEVGVSPRALASVLRFRRVFDMIEQTEIAGVETALKAGYFDQPQMARDFRRFLGVTARDWARQRAGLALSLAASETYKN